MNFCFFFFFQAEDGIRDDLVTGVQTCALPICTTVRVWLPEADFTEGERVNSEPCGQRRSLLLFGHEGNALDKGAEFLRESGYSVVVASSLERAEESLQEPNCPMAGLLLMASRNQACYAHVAATA